MDDSLLQEALAYAKELFAGDHSGHDYFHTLRVCRTALTLAEAEHADPLVTGLAAALHDADDRKLSPQTSETKANARRFLNEQGVDAATAETVSGVASATVSGAAVTTATGSSVTRLGSGSEPHAITPNENANIKIQMISFVECFIAYLFIVRLSLPQFPCPVNPEIASELQNFSEQFRAKRKKRQENLSLFRFSVKDDPDGHTGGDPQ